MEREAFALMAEVEAEHWWFRGRRDIIAATVRMLDMRPDSAILDAGCGSGGNLAMLAQFGRVYAFEHDAPAMHQAQMRGVGEVVAGMLPGEVPFTSAPPFDLIGLFDVLEHLSQPVESLRALAGRLAPGGAMIITVPAMPWLWGPHDRLHGHQRRYTAALLRDHAAQAGLRVEYLTGINHLLLPVAILQRLRERMFGFHPRHVALSPMLNRLLYRIWQLELQWIPRMAIPFGLSLLAIVRRSDP